MVRFSKAFINTLREVPSDAEIPSHRLLLRAGFIRKKASGLYDILPLGMRVIRKIEDIIREEMNRAGALEIMLPLMHPSELWMESGRWDVYGKEMIKFKDRHGRYYSLGPTAEEMITDLVRKEVKSYKQLPVNLYQIGRKFRDEIRPRFGLMRAREFIMKDAYSFHVDDEDAEREYWNMHSAYVRMFTRMGFVFKSIEAETGEIGGKFSHEFVVLVDSGESRLFYCAECGFAASDEKLEGEGIGFDACPRCGGSLRESRGIEIGHIFKLGTKYSESMGAVFIDEDGQEKFMVMGCYGIGVTRIMAAAVEQNHDDYGIMWHPSISPYDVEAIPVNVKDGTTASLLERVVDIVDGTFDVLVDDRNLSPGVKFKDADLIGIPFQVILGRKSSEGIVEVKVRKTGERFNVGIDGVLHLLEDLKRKLVDEWCRGVE